ncbi:MAG: hypothetical protein ACO20H_11710 [Bacteriovoracaceae bacterium]
MKKFKILMGKPIISGLATGSFAAGMHFVINPMVGLEASARAALFQFIFVSIGVGLAQKLRLVLTEKYKKRK